MRKILLFFVPLLFCVFITSAQNINPDNDAAMQLVSANKASIGLSADELNNVKVSNTYLIDNATGIRMVYLNQTHQGIPVLNQMLVLAFKNGKLISNQGSFNHSVPKLANVQNGIPSVTAESAVQSALSDRGLRATQMAVALNRFENGQKIEFGNMGVSRENITARLMWVPVEELVNKVNTVTKVQLAWEVYIIPKVTSDYWRIRVDATNNSIIGMTNLTDYDNWGPSEMDKNGLNYPGFTYSNFQSEVSGNSLFDFKKPAEDPNIITTATYRVVPFPAESPWAPGGIGSFATRTDPWLAAPGNATTLKWHTGLGGVDYAYTRGNNVWAYEDRTAPQNTGSQAKSANSTTALPNLTFNFVNDTNQSPILTSPPNQQFNITNLFYWNNIIHDVMYIYGFTEATANFQDDNMGRGGLGNDHVNAEAQDPGGTNNANFSTPADGGSGRMQMYLWTLGGSNPQKDGDVDNGIVVHEFGHGISNRFTGGGGGGCLGNAEQMGEGWSDYYALMFTQNWATATLATGFNTPRGIGLYALNGTNLFGGSPPGTGIRHFPYCTNFAVNSQVYLANLPTSPHDRGEIWCATLWDMTWNIINQVGTINPNLYNLAGGGGNAIAFKLVTEGLRLQQCSPGFISGRNAILAADQALYGGAYYCAIWEAFRRRGMGAFASEGSTGSVNDQVPDFTPPLSLSATVSAATIPEGQTLTYTNTVTTCSPVTGYTLRDTLPLNVTYLSGGTYDAVNRVVSFPVAQGAGATNYVFTVTVNMGSYFPPVTLLNETVPGASIPAGWAATIGVGPTNWVSSTAQTHSAPNALFALDNAAAITDFRVSTTAPIAMGAQPATFTFWHNYDTEPSWDGGVVEISTNGGANWVDLGPTMSVNGYNASLDAAGTNPIAGRPAFTGNSAGWIQTTSDLTPYVNQNALFRFRMTSDDNTAAVGWYVDDILIQALAQVKMRTSLFNPSNVRVAFRDMTTLITQFVACAPVINTQPTNSTICTASTTSFTCVGVSTGGVTYQWQLSTTGAGGPWVNLTNVAPYSGVTTTTLTINPTAVGMNGYMYRCIVTGGCAPNATSNAATLTVFAASIGGSVTPANSSVCGLPNSGTLTLAGHTGAIVRWESATAIAGPYTPIANTSTTLSFTNVGVTTYFRAVIQVPGCAAVTSSIATVTFISAQAIQIISDAGTTLCQGDPALLTVVLAPITNTFANPAPITIPSVGNGSPYPSVINVTGLPVTGVSVSTVRLINMSHTWGDDVDVLLQSPTLQNVVLMSDVGGTVAIPNATYTFSDAGPAMSAGTANPTGTYRPTNNGATDNFPAPGPGSVTQATPALALFGSVANVNGNWNLFVVDDVGGDQGVIAGGWDITFSQPGGPVGPGTFSWSPAAGLNQTTGNPVAASPATTTTYTVLYDNGLGCIRQASITLNINARPAVTAQPSNTTVCSGSAATFTVGATGAGATYQWQQSTTGAGGPWVALTNTAPYSGVNTATLTINPATVAMNGYYYRCVIGGTCPPNATSNGAILNVSALPTVTVTPTTGCGGVAGINGLLLTAGGANSYTWAPVGGLYTNAIATIAYTGGNTPTVYAAPTSYTGYTVTGTNTTTGCSSTAIALVNYTPPAPTVTPSSVTMCLGDAAVKLKSSSSQSFTSSFASGTVNITIPDGPALPPVPASYPATTSTIPVTGIPGTATVANIRVTLNITHAWVSDLVIALKAPNGSVFNLDALLNRTNNAGANFTGTIISSAGVNTLNSAAAPYTGTFRPDAAGATFTALGFTFPGGPAGYIPTVTVASGLYSVPNGNWELAIYDAGAPDAGVLNNWSLAIDYIIGVPATPAVWAPAAGLFSDATALTPYVAGTAVDSVWTRPTPAGVYPYTATVQSLPPPPSVPTTTSASGNGQALITFNVRNNNAYPVTLTDIAAGHLNAGTANMLAFYKPSAINGAPGAISAANGWIQFGAGTATIPVALTITPSLSGLTLVIPAGATYGIAFQSLTGANAANVSYTTLAAGTYVSSSGGCDIITGTNIGYGGTAAPAAPTFTPRGFRGSVSLVAGVAACTSPSKTVIVTVNQPINIGAVSANQVICTDKVATFSVSGVTGTGPITYQWQVSTNSGGTYANVTNGGVYSGATTATLTITAPPVTMNGYYYRCIINSAAPCAPVTSAFRILNVNPLPTIVISAAPHVRLYPGLRTTLTSTVSPVAAATYTWLRNGVAVAGGTTGTLNVDIDGLGDYRLRVTDVNGCTNLSNTITIADSVNGKCFVYPNPNSGQFQVRYYSTATNVFPRSLTIFDSKGDRVFTQMYTIGRPYDRMDVDIRKYGKGMYWVELGDMNGNRLTMCRVVIQ